MRRTLLVALICIASAVSSPVRADWAPTVPHGLRVERITSVDGARALAFAPNGDLFVGTRGEDVYVVPHAESSAGGSRVFVHIADAPDAGVAFGNGALYVGTQHAVWKIAYRTGQLTASGAAQKLAAVRMGSPPAGSDGDVHITTSVAVFGTHVYASVGSSCNACVETDPTRATIGQVSNGRYIVMARRIRNAIALAVDPGSHALWASDAGQDELPPGHPYEFFDDVTAHRTPADYGWPYCYEDRKHKPGTSQDCAQTATPRIVFPAYETPVGAVFYPQSQRGRYALPPQYRSGVFVTLHGSWHGPAQGLSGFMPPRVVFVPMHGDSPARTLRWNDPSAQWREFAGGYQEGSTSSRSGRPTGISIGPDGDLFVADDETGSIYRIRP